MQIDFHHTVTYVAARAAGFGHREAETVAYCAQYVDDAVNGGTILFSNGAMYSRISSAHKMLDYRNFEKLANHHVWLPFHFLPGNGGRRAGENPDGNFIEKIICRPNSPVAMDVIQACIQGRNKLYGLHRLGITMHVLADTWAHQGFAGVCSRVNNIRALDDKDSPDERLMNRLEHFFGASFDKTASAFIGDVMPLGHGAALSYPDLPFLTWRYRDHEGNLLTRDNPRSFLTAADEMCRAMQRFRTGDVSREVPGLNDAIREKLLTLFQDMTDGDKNTRHEKWLKHIREGYFGFPPVKLAYRSKGAGSWKYEALGTRKLRDKTSELFPYDPSFLGCDWKLFHDALQAHRFEVIHDILPRYGICAA